MATLEFRPCNGYILVSLLEEEEAAQFEYERPEKEISMGEILNPGRNSKNELEEGNYVWFETRFLKSVTFGDNEVFLIPESCVFACGALND